MMYESDSGAMSFIPESFSNGKEKRFVGIRKIPPAWFSIAYNRLDDNEVRLA